MKIVQASLGYEKEQLKGNFGFKGSALTCLWQVAVRLETEENVGIGVGVQSALWSDSFLFSEFGEQRSNELMFQVTEYAAEQLVGTTFDTPYDAFDMLFPKVYEYAKNLTGLAELRKTFVLNALVAIDFALWQLWMKEYRKERFDSICFFDGRKQSELANIPLVTYGMAINDVRRLALQGTPLLKIKIGSDPDGSGDVKRMLDWDKTRLAEIHEAVKDVHTPYTEDGKVLYYLDANGRYDCKETLLDLLQFVERQGIGERIILIEEPFDENNKTYIGDIPYCFAADESVHGIEDVRERFELGYQALTLKPIAKTLSLTVRMAEFAREKGMACFCADLTVNPVMLSWNQCVAARLKPLDKMRIGVVESNGKQNYVNWEQMKNYHPMRNASFLSSESGVYQLGDAFYNNDGGVFLSSEYYRALTLTKGDM